MSLSTTSNIKAQLTELLGANAPSYFAAINNFANGRWSRQEFEDAVVQLLDQPTLIQLHNALIISLFDATTHRQAPPPIPPPVLQPKQPPQKRRRVDDPNNPLRSTRLKHWTLGVGKRERDRIRTLESTEPPFTQQPTEEISMERGLVLLAERGGAYTISCRTRSH